MQKNPLAAKVALVTGAARRIGAEISRTLHAAGMNVVLHYNSSEDAAVKLCEELNKIRSNSAVVVRADLQNIEGAGSLIQRAVESWQRLDALVNNASRFYRTTVGKTSEFAWDDLMNSNLKGPFFLSQAAAPFLSETQGSIINICDTHAEKPLRDYVVYCISKAGLIMQTKALAKELGPHVRVNAISPGSIMWPEGNNELSEMDKQKIIDHTALLRSGSAVDIAKAVLFFVRDADYVTGQVLVVDGGRALK